MWNHEPRKIRMRKSHISETEKMRKVQSFGRLQRDKQTDKKGYKQDAKNRFYLAKGRAVTLNSNNGRNQKKICSHGDVILTGVTSQNYVL